jgi:uncharacterized membrane protein YdjX (TVP38/TMEM64 family)
VLFGVVLFFEILFYHSAIINGLVSFVETSGAYGWVTILFLQFTQVVLIPIPAYFITLTSIKMFPNDLPLLFVLTLATIVAGVITTYWIGRKWGKKAVVWAAGDIEEYNKWVGVLKSKKTNLFYFLTILFPIFPDDVLCLVAGSIRMNFWWFLLCNVVGRAIGLISFMFVFASVGNSIITMIVFGVILVLLIIYKIILKRSERNEPDINR